MRCMFTLFVVAGLCGARDAMLVGVLLVKGSVGVGAQEGSSISMTAGIILFLLVVR